jgi:dipeptide transport system ATP-binding protein
VVAETADRVVVQYAGLQVERNDAQALFDSPHHPYTAALLAALPDRAEPGSRLAAIPGVVPGQHNRPPGCQFAPRCPRVFDACVRKPPLASAELGQALCHKPLATGEHFVALSGGGVGVAA